MSGEAEVAAVTLGTVWSVALAAGMLVAALTLGILVVFTRSKNTFIRDQFDKAVNWLAGKVGAEPKPQEIEATPFSGRNKT